MPKRVIPVLSLFATVLLLFVLNFTTPTGIGPFGVLVFFGACYLVVLGIALMLVTIFMKLAGKQMGRKGYLYAAIIAFGPVMLLLIQSLGSLGPATIGLVALVIMVACFLVSKRA